MSIKISGIQNLTKDQHFLTKTFAFVDTNRDFYIVADTNAVVKMDYGFPQFSYEAHETVEDFCHEVLGSNLLKTFGNNDFEIEIKIK